MTLSYEEILSQAAPPNLFVYLKPKIPQPIIESNRSPFNETQASPGQKLSPLPSIQMPQSAFVISDKQVLDSENYSFDVPDFFLEFSDEEKPANHLNQAAPETLRSFSKIDQVSDDPPGFGNFSPESIPHREIDLKLNQPLNSEKAFSSDHLLHQEHLSKDTFIENEGDFQVDKKILKLSKINDSNQIVHTVSNPGSKTSLPQPQNFHSPDNISARSDFISKSQLQSPQIFKSDSDPQNSPDLKQVPSTKQAVSKGKQKSDFLFQKPISQGLTDFQNSTSNLTYSSFADKLESLRQTSDNSGFSQSSEFQSKIYFPSNSIFRPNLNNSIKAELAIKHISTSVQYTSHQKDLELFHQLCPFAVSSIEDRIDNFEVELSKGVLSRPRILYYLSIFSPHIYDRRVGLIIEFLLALTFSPNNNFSDFEKKILVGLKSSVFRSVSSKIYHDLPHLTHLQNLLSSINLKN